MNGAGLKRMTVVIAVCALVGALAGIAGSAAAPSKSSSKASSTAAKKAAKRKAFEKGFNRAGRPGLAFGFGPGPMGGPALHSEAVVPNADGTGFDTITSDSGTLLSVDGTTVHLKQATDKATYKADAAIDVGSDAKVIRNRKDATLSDLKAGDHVHVLQSPKGNLVIAEDDAFEQQEQKDHPEFRHDFGPPPGAPNGGPPPAGPDNESGSDQSGSAPSTSNSTNNS